MLLKKDQVEKILCCPRTGNALEKLSSSKMRSAGIEGYEYHIVDDYPILIDFNLSLLDEQSFIKSSAQSRVARRSYYGIMNILKSLVNPVNKITSNNIEKLIMLLKDTSEPEDSLNVLIIGGGSIGQGMSKLYDDPLLSIISFDIYKSDNTQFVADAHNLPLPAQYFDCVVIQAVLEHVLYPQKVVNEISKVLKTNGIVYSETPFLQHVHEGAYDFTRYSDSGHRYLYRNFTEIQSGVCLGAGTQLLWSIDYFFRSLFRSRVIGKFIKVIFFWLQYFDRIIPEKYSIDAASGVYFMGRKANKSISHKDIVKYYKGAL